MQTTLIEIGYPQPSTPLITNNSTADGIKLMVLNIIDEASQFHVAKVVRQDKVKTYTDLGNCDADTLIEHLQE